MEQCVQPADGRMSDPQITAQPASQPLPLGRHHAPTPKHGRSRWQSRSGSRPPPCPTCHAWPPAHARTDWGFNCRREKSGCAKYLPRYCTQRVAPGAAVLPCCNRPMRSLGVPCKAPPPAHAHEEVEEGYGSDANHGEHGEQVRAERVLQRLQLLGQRGGRVAGGGTQHWALRPEDAVPRRQDEHPRAAGAGGRAAGAYAVMGGGGRGAVAKAGAWPGTWEVPRPHTLPARRTRTHTSRWLVINTVTRANHSM